MISGGVLPPPPFKIMDFGCGTGGLTQALGQFGPIEGVDFSEEALAYCQKRGLKNTRLIQSADEVEAENYDLVGSFDVLEHIEDDQSVIEALHRSLKPGGVLMVTVPALKVLWGGEDVVSHHVRRYTRSEVKAKIQRAGFEVIQASYFNSLLFPMILAVRVFHRLFRPHTLTQSDVKPISPLFNGVFCRMFALERKLLGVVSLPVGASLLVIARRRYE